MIYDMKKSTLACFKTRSLVIIIIKKKKKKDMSCSITDQNF